MAWQPLGWQPLSDTLRFLNTSDDDDVITLSAQQIPLTDRVSLQRYATPCRGLGCSHLECFDLASYCHVNASRLEQLRCPVCDRVCGSSTLKVCDLTMRLLKLAPKECSHVTIHPDISSGLSKRNLTSGWVVTFDRGTSSASGAHTDTVLISDSDEEIDECVVTNDTRAPAEVESASSTAGTDAEIRPFAFGTRIYLSDMPVVPRPELPYIHPVSLRTVVRPAAAKPLQAPPANGHSLLKPPAELKQLFAKKQLAAGHGHRNLGIASAASLAAPTPSPSPAAAAIPSHAAASAADPTAQIRCVAASPRNGGLDTTMLHAAQLISAAAQAPDPSAGQMQLAKQQLACHGHRSLGILPAASLAAPTPSTMPAVLAAAAAPSHAAAGDAALHAARPSSAVARAAARAAPKRAASAQPSGSAKAGARGSQAAVQPPDPPGPNVIAAHLLRFKAPRRVAVYWLEEKGGGTWYAGDVVSVSHTHSSVTVRYDSDGSRDEVNIREESVVWLD